MSLLPSQSEAAKILSGGDWFAENPALPVEPQILEPRNRGFTLENARTFSRAIFVTLSKFEEADRVVNRGVVQGADVYQVYVIARSFEDAREIRENCRQICRDYSKQKYPLVGAACRPEFAPAGDLDVVGEALYILAGEMRVAHGGVAG